MSDDTTVPPGLEAAGGAILNFGNLHLSNVLVTWNRAEIGGGLFNWGTAHLDQVDMTHNVATWHTSDGCGGAIANIGRLVILRSFFGDNQSNGDGGALCHGIGRSGFIGPPVFNLFQVTIAGNRAAHHGGGLITYGTSRVNAVFVLGNTAEHGRGGGIDSHARLDLLDSIVGGNRALGGRRRVRGFPPSIEECVTCGLGGGVFSDTDLRTHRTSIEDNVADRDGGGIYALELFQLDRSGVIRNAAFGNGGGLYVQGRATFEIALSIATSTISRNAVRSGQGGGIYVAGGSDATLVFATVAFNAALFGAGGIHIAAGSNVRFTNTILARNVFANCGGVAGRSLGYTLEDASGCSDVSAIGDVRHADPLLRPLAFEGARTATHALGAGSPAIDAIPHGAAAICPLPFDDADQRGVARPIGFGCDIGAYEARLVVVAPPLRSAVVTTEGAMMALKSTAGELQESMAKSQDPNGAPLASKLVSHVSDLREAFEKAVQSNDLGPSVKAILPMLDPIAQILEALDGCCQNDASQMFLVELPIQLEDVRADLVEVLRRLTKSRPGL